jgi:hypothetical protein
MGGVMAFLPVPASSALGLTRAERRVAKEIAAVRAASTAVAAREAAKLDAITEVAETALLNAGELACIEQLLVLRTPHAAGRFGFIGDRATMAMGGVVTQMARRL